MSKYVQNLEIYVLFAYMNHATLKLNSNTDKHQRRQFAKHEKIVQCMTPEELADPKLMSEDLSNAEEKCPRVQRLSVESGIPEKDVALFVAEFEAMRQV